MKRPPNGAHSAALPPLEPDVHGSAAGAAPRRPGETCS